MTDNQNCLGLKKEDFFYFLPNEQIAQTPAEPRDSSRLLVYDKETHEVQHVIFSDILTWLKKGDVLVINNTRVMPSRLFAFDAKGRRFEILLLKRLNYTDWEALLKPARKAKIGQTLIVNESLSVSIQGIEPETGIRRISCNFEGVFENILSKFGEMPLPPYITQKLDNTEKYQTVYSKTLGSSAAPTAGLHFTKELLTKIKNQGVEIVEILLHVGLGTFRPVKVSHIAKHVMHSEYYEISKEAAHSINIAKSEGRRIIAVGTTSVRALEAAANVNKEVMYGVRDTDIFIYPPYQFKIVDSMITNFHLPESTLLMLVSAFIGREKTLELYDIAIKNKYRFFSFGDAMFLK
ncbi:MAG TPA: tRNA preQ1(34) S-adenosylmethionine ribosyltransferase-isomerase QueA [Clostridia bacterium]|nr:tRNA preQ1(34) S-adenosylmethionine ribosyltransferase-isomerase QueA [Clostridia bacterium]